MRNLLTRRRPARQKLGADKELLPLGEGDAKRRVRAVETGFLRGLPLAWLALAAPFTVHAQAREDAPPGAAAFWQEPGDTTLEEAETSLIAYARARERLEHLDAAAAASERATELARLRFEEGAADFLEVLDAERTLLEAQDRSAAGRTVATNWVVSVYRALGGAPPNGSNGSR